MRLHLYQQEVDLLRKKAEEYKKQTGDTYSLNHIALMLAAKYEERLQDDLEDVMKEKIEEYTQENKDKS